MDREFNIRFKLSDVLKLLVMSPVVVVLVLWALSWPWSDNNAPAWVQAIGSIGAIGVAIWVGSAQARATDVERKRRGYHYIVMAYETAKSAQTTAIQFSNAIQQAPVKPSALYVYDEMHKYSCVELAQFSYASMTALDFAQSWTIHRRLMELIGKQISLYRSGDAPPQSFAVDIQELVDQSAGYVEKMEVALQTYRARAGQDVCDGHHP